MSSAIVVGGSIAGLLAARVLADFYDTVTVVERDQFPDGPEQRAGVPQARHLHVLLARGHQIIETLFPGLDAELDSAGVPRVELGYDTTIYGRGGWIPRFHSGIYTRSVSRALLEYAVRCRLVANPHVRFMEGWQVNDLATDADRTRVTGVLAQTRGGSREQGAVEADFIVDASGRTSHAPDWLKAIGYDAPEETVVNAFLGYATRWYNKAPGFNQFWKDLLIASIPPKNPRGGGLWEVEGGRWVVTLAGVNRDYPPTDEAGFIDFARSLANPAIYDAIRDAEPISDIYGYQRTENRLRHFDRLPRWPHGFAVVGDAVCAFNPVYGQGITTAALQVEALQAALRQGAAGDIQKRIARVIQTTWLMATGEDYRYPSTEGPRPGFSTKLMHKYIDRVQVLLCSDADMAQTFTEVSSLLTPPAALFKPSHAWKVLTYRPKQTA